MKDNVNSLMLANAIEIVEASPLAWEWLGQMASLLLTVTTKEHAEYVLSQRYSRVYTQEIIRGIVAKATPMRTSKPSKRSKQFQTPLLFA